jgi:RIO kinase 2
MVTRGTDPFTLISSLGSTPLLEAQSRHLFQSVFEHIQIAGKHKENMKLDVTCMRYLSKDNYRVLQAVEMGMRNHELVPVSLITNIARLRSGGTYKILSTLLRYKLVAHANNQYDGYRLSYLGFDILALRTLLVRGVITNVGSQIGIGKESDIFEALDAEGNEVVIKIHRLGRTSFRAVRRHRDYMAGKHKASWLYMSRLAAIKEFAFMKALYAHGFPTPTPIDQNRHVVVMSRVNGFPMAQVKSGNMQGADLYFERCMSILVRLGEHGLIHCDFNEFNLMVGHDGSVTLIDFPQMVSVSHPNAEELFNRDVNGLMKFFRMKMRYDAPDEAIPKLANITQSGDIAGSVTEVLAQSGMTEGEDQDLQQYLNLRREDDGTEDVAGEFDDVNEDDEDDDDEECFELPEEGQQAPELIPDGATDTVFQFAKQVEELDDVSSGNENEVGSDEEDDALDGDEIAGNGESSEQRIELGDNVPHSKKKLSVEERVKM